MKKLVLAFLFPIVGCGGPTGPKVWQYNTGGTGGDDVAMGGSAAGSGGSAMGGSNSTGGGSSCYTTWLGECAGVKTGFIDCGPEGRVMKFEDGVEFPCEGVAPEVDCTDASILAQQHCVDLTLGSGGTGGDTSTGGASNTGGSGGSCTEKEWCLDNDADGFINPTVCVMSCTAPTEKYRANRGFGNDCYDSNYSAKPNPSDWKSVDRGDGSYDYNCDDVQEMEFKEVGSCLKLNVPDKLGWVGSVPACGTTGKYIDEDSNGHCIYGGTDRVNRCR